MSTALFDQVRQCGRRRPAVGTGRPRHRQTGGLELRDRRLADRSGTAGHDGPPCAECRERGDGRGGQLVPSGQQQWRVRGGCGGRGRQRVHPVGAGRHDDGRGPVRPPAGRDHRRRPGSVRPASLAVGGRHQDGRGDEQRDDRGEQARPPGSGSRRSTAPRYWPRCQAPRGGAGRGDGGHRPKARRPGVLTSAATIAAASTMPTALPTPRKGRAAPTTVRALRTSPAGHAHRIRPRSPRVTTA